MQMVLRTIFLLFIAGFCSCNKEIDNSDPVIDFLAPEVNLITDADQLSITVRVYDESDLQSVKIGIVDENFIPVVQPQWFYPQKNDTLISLNISLMSLVNGRYFVLAQAFDGENTRRKYLPFAFAGALVLQPEIFVSTNGAGEFSVWKVNPLMTEASLVFTAPGSLKALISGGQNGLIYLVSDAPSRIRTLDCKSGEVAWEKQAAMPWPEYTSVFFAGDALLACDKNGIMAAYHHATGADITVTPAAPNTLTSALFADETYIFAAQHLQQSQQQVLSFIYRQSLQPFRSYHLESGVLAVMEGTTQSNVLVVRQANGEALFDLFDKGTGLYDESAFALSQSIGCVIKYNPDAVLLMTPDRIGLYSLTNHQFSVLITGQDLRDVTDGSAMDLGFIIADGKHLYAEANQNGLTFGEVIGKLTIGYSKKPAQ
ncbi:MAG: hypothetical protein KGZ82_13710 [Bacteroidales bacterium]|nr:hypothetical protein [Bacteroidales bacterium]